MKSLFKKVAVGIGALLLASTATAAVLSTNVTAGGVHLLSTNRASVYSIELTSDKAVTVDFYDCESLAAPYYGTNSTSAAYTTRSSYATNYVTSMIGYNGMTNWYTNAGIWTITSTNAAATNALPVMISTSVGANQSKTLLTDALFVRGITFRPSTNVSIIINYRSGQ